MNASQAELLTSSLSVARGADKYAKNKVAAYPDLKLHKIIKVKVPPPPFFLHSWSQSNVAVQTSRTAKARLLHYFPIDKPLPAGTSLDR